jgi:hypothetical protein
VPVPLYMYLGNLHCSYTLHLHFCMPFFEMFFAIQSRMATACIAMASSADRPSQTNASNRGWLPISAVCRPH